MKNILRLICLLLLTSGSAQGQGEQNIWAFGDGAGLDFSSGTPVSYRTNIFPAHESSASICDASGQLLFYTNGFWIWNRNHEIMPELTGGVSGYTWPTAPTIGYPPLMTWNGGQADQQAAIAGVPFQPGKYYVFSLSTSGQLFYTIVDMSLNSGMGGIASGKKGVFLASGVTGKMTVVKGCNNIWLMARSRTANQYRAYEISDTGIVTTPVTSSVGQLPLSWYRCGVIKFSADGMRMAAACNELSTGKGGVELYDFNPATGVLSNPLVLDSSSTTSYYQGACFSPDGSKLYASTSSLSYQNVFYYGAVHQFDLGLSTPAAIRASNTIVFDDIVHELDNIGDLKRGRDNKIYFCSGKSRAYMHCITQPNLPGWACTPIFNMIALTSGTTGRGIPNDIALITPPDSIHTRKTVAVCFRDSVLLIADSGKRYVWDNGSTSRQRMITAAGTYVVRYINQACKHQTDSLDVRFIPVPVTGATAYSCPGSGQAKAWVRPQTGDTSTFTYSWKTQGGRLLQQHRSNYGDTLAGINPGTYRVQITTASGCDTILSVTIQSLPVPEASFTADSIACTGVAVRFTNTSTAPLWSWSFGDGVDSRQQHPSHSYDEEGTYTAALVVTNLEGCTDTAYKDIAVHSLRLTLTADRNIVNRGDLVQLLSSGSEPYTVSAWEPAFLFTDQAASSQSVIIDTTRNFTVMGVSAYGCTAKASVEVAVNPFVSMPNGFTPNGDGINDRFRPVSSGYIFVRYFEIYNRYGQNIYHARGIPALDGWDGTFKGQPMELGTYYYQINVETKEGGTIYLKGDVILLR